MCLNSEIHPLTLLHSERPKLHTILAFLSAIGLMLRKMGTPPGEVVHSHMKKICLPFLRASFKGKKGGKILSFQSRSRFGSNLLPRVANWKSKKMYPSVNMVEKYGGISKHLNILINLFCWQ